MYLDKPFLNALFGRSRAWTRYGLMAGLAACGRAGAAVTVTAEAPCGVFEEGRCPQFTVTGIATGAWTVVDWLGAPVAHGTLAGGRIVCPVPDRGYYEVRVGGAASGFAVVPDFARRARDPESFLALDAALTAVCRRRTFACPWNGGDTYASAAEAIRLAGFTHLRDRISWRASQPAAGAPVRFGACLDNARHLQRFGIRVSGLYHDAPDWAGRLEKLPGDLLATYRFARAAAETFGPLAADWEFWNEEDISFAPEPAWDFVAAHKAAALGFRAGNPKALVLPGALCQPRRGTYDQLLFANDLGKYLDVFNFHCYQPLARIPEVFAELRAFLAQAGLPDQAVWVTENGTNQEGESTEDGAYRGVKKHSPDQERLLAEFYPKAQAYLRREGVARNFHFVFGAYNERNNTKDWGALRRDGTVKPVYAAMSTMQDELGAADQEGEVALGADVRGFLYRLPDGTRTLLAWRLSPLDTAAGRVTDVAAPAAPCHLPLAPGTYALTDLCGRRTRVTAGAQGLDLPLTRHPVYLRNVRGLAVSAPARGTGRIGPQAAPGTDLTVIVRADFDRRDFTVGKGKTLAELQKREGRLRVQVWNLSDRAKRGSLAVSGGVVKGLPPTLDLPAWGKAECAVTYASAPELPPDAASLDIAGTFDGRRITRFSAPVNDIARTLAECAARPLAFEDPRHWLRNTSASDYACRYDAAEKAIRFDVFWRDDTVDRWFYPFYRLRPGEDASDANMLYFEVKSAQNKVENDYRYNYIYLAFGADGKQGGDQVAYAAPREGWERRMVDLRGARRRAGDAPLASIRIGGNPCGTLVNFWIRNMRLYRARPVSRKDSPK